jgi:D-alanyl-D-alanine carboxypeptidase
LLAESVEKPKTFQQVLDEMLLTPLGLNHTVFPLNVTFIGQHTLGYTTLAPNQGEGDSTDYSPTQAFSAGQIISTIDDLRLYGMPCDTRTSVFRLVTMAT